MIARMRLSNLVVQRAEDAQPWTVVHINGMRTDHPNKHMATNAAMLAGLYFQGEGRPTVATDDQARTITVTVE